MQVGEVPAAEDVGRDVTQARVGEAVVEADPQMVALHQAQASTAVAVRAAGACQTRDVIEGADLVKVGIDPVAADGHPLGLLPSC